MTWTPEHQAAFENKYGKVQSAVNQGPPRPIPDPPRAKAPKGERRPWTHVFMLWMLRLTVWTFLWLIGGWVLAWLLHLPNFVKPAIGVPFGVMVFAWIAVIPIGLVYCMFSFWHGWAKEVGTPLPSLQEIEQQLIKEGHANPTLQDCLAVDQYLRHNRNEVLATGAAVAVATHFWGRW